MGCVPERGFRRGLVLAHHNHAQMPRETPGAVSANARSKIYFTVDRSVGWVSA